MASWSRDFPGPNTGLTTPTTKTVRWEPREPQPDHFPPFAKLRRRTGHNKVDKFVAVPTIFNHRDFRFFFYSNEGSPREPVHVHVEKDGDEAKFWLRPDISVAYNDRYSARTLRELIGIVFENRSRIERAWNEFFR